ncbi:MULTISPECIES: metal-dependent hydrolase [Halorussus]|uniref:metal-dependent hydrolase n=1 Tax=Halorussus TaxID=1070314 RepID=UPI0020A0C3E2|nr:metal-dependent hydrolase [Halorussus vallis]USZ76478.1 metal-dependent hydrolase [Halorussus vallis]
MMVGHAMLAFALAASAASARGWSRERAMAFGIAAGAFAAVPDVDMAYALVGLAQVGVASVWTMTAAFWGSSHLVHRAVTHSLVVAVPAALAFALVARERGRPAALALLAGLVAVAWAESGVLGAAVMTLFGLAGLAVALVAADRADLGVRSLFAAALLGLLSHPFGDLFTGAPPRMLYPLDVRLFAERLVLLADPTLNLLAVFALELCTIWLAGYVYLRLTDQDLFWHVDARAALGVAYALAALAMPAPTLEVSYHFVFSVLAVGVVGVAPHLLPSRSVLSADWNDAVTWTLTGLAAVSFATIAYAAVYVIS